MKERESAGMKWEAVSCRQEKMSSRCFMEQQFVHTLWSLPIPKLISGTMPVSLDGYGTREMTDEDVSCVKEGIAF